MTQSCPPAPVWRKSSRCDNNLCVEVAFSSAGVAVRDNARPHVALGFDRASWQALLRDIGQGRLDR